MATSFGLQRAFTNLSASSTDTQLVAGATGKVTRVLGVWLLAQGTSTAVTFNSFLVATSTPITPVITCANTGGGIVMPFAGEGWFETETGADLTITSGAGSTVGVVVLYVVVNP